MKKLFILAAALALSTSLAQIETETRAIDILAEATGGYVEPCPPAPTDQIIFVCLRTDTASPVTAALVSAYADREGWEAMQPKWREESEGLMRGYLYRDDRGDLWVASFMAMDGSMVVGFYDAE